MTDLLDLCPKTDIDLTRITEKAMETALHVMEDVRSKVTEQDYYFFMRALCDFLDPHSAPCWEDSCFRLAIKAMQCSILIDEPREALDKLRAALWAIENLCEDEVIVSLPECRDEDIAHLRGILAYWRSSEISIVRNGAVNPIER
jgi:hypothetical protein